ncbi:MAG: type VI secretion system tip protein TssI/VgrG [Pirellulaceae bacterium]|nr:type VI secretion system tip protein TssI/VgrG [Pirellulaceae bacterium]
MARYTQDNRALRITTPLGENVLLLAEFSGTEGLSELFEFDISLWSEKLAIDPKSLVGKSVTIQVENNRALRYFNGIVSRFCASGRRGAMRQYRASVVPTLWLLTRVQDCRIFQDKSIPDIIKAVFESRGLTNYKLSALSSSYPVLEYVVQYRETDFNFVSRLMERAGIFYYFEHKNNEHTLMLGDSNSTFQSTTPAKVQIIDDSTAKPDMDCITAWENTFSYQSGKWTQTDYNFIDHPASTNKTPADELLLSLATQLDLHQITRYERYDFPGLFEEKNEGQDSTKTRIQGNDVGYQLVQGVSQCAFFVPGQKFTVNNSDVESEIGKKYVLTSVKHKSHEAASYPMTVASGEALRTYDNEFKCIPDDVQFRPERRTPIPSVQGIQSAVVVGPSAEEIYTDSYGRIKVQFFWDRAGVRNENSSCWIRCAQFAAGKNWGSLFLPRVGQEVAVSFLDGNVDRPLVTGVLYNADQMPAYPLPKDKTKSYIKTNSTMGGDGFNEICFEDLAKNEQIFVHAQRNFDLRVLNDRLQNVLNDCHLIVGQEVDGEKQGSQYQSVFVNKELHVMGNQIEHIEGNFQLTVGKGDAENGGNFDFLVANKMTESIEGDHDFTLNGDQKQKIYGKQSVEVIGDVKQNVVGSHSTNVLGGRKQKILEDDSLQIGGALHQKTEGNVGVDAGADIYLKGGMNVVIEAGAELTLKVGGSYIVINPSGVSVVGPLVNLNSGGDAGEGTPPATTSPDDPDSPSDAAQAQPTEPTAADDAQSGSKSAPDSLS